LGPHGIAVEITETRANILSPVYPLRGNASKYSARFATRLFAQHAGNGATVLVFSYPSDFKDVSATFELGAGACGPVHMQIYCSSSTLLVHEVNLLYRSAGAHPALFRFRDITAVATGNLTGGIGGLRKEWNRIAASGPC
jgi:hypothetical protein